MAPPSRKRQAKHTINTPFVHPVTTNNNFLESDARQPPSTPEFRQQPAPQPCPPEVTRVVQPPEQPTQSSREALNPAAPEFIPFALRTSTYDCNENQLDDADFEEHGERLEQMVIDEQLWSNFGEADLSGAPPPPCQCHGVARGACPEVMAYTVDRISRGLAHSGITPNMDSLREPLKFQNFPIKAWEWALHGYFDAHEILQGLQFGWDVSFTTHPKPKDAKWNLQGASLFEKHVQIYVDKEQQFGTLVGPFDQAKLPFEIFCSPLNTVNKRHSDVRRTVVDCTQLDLGINAFIDAHMHRGQEWKLSLPTSATIIRLIKETREKYPGERVFIFKIDFARWYRWFTLDPVHAVFFAI